jgi:hypothetical protein
VERRKGFVASSSPTVVGTVGSPRSVISLTRLYFSRESALPVQRQREAQVLPAYS